MKSKLKAAWPYQKDKMNLPVNDVHSAYPFYLALGFQFVRELQQPNPCVILSRDGVEIGLSQNGGDPTQDGCVFEVENVDELFAEFRSKPLKVSESLKTEKHDHRDWKVFYLIAPDGLCYSFGEPQ
jgi:hypothetical protein